MNKNIGILTWHYYPNFGSALQAFALQKTLKLMGNKVSFINYQNPKFGTVSNFKRTIYLIFGNTVGKIPIKYIERYRFATFCFSHKYLKTGKLTTNKNELQALSSGYNVIICGSDQIWAPNVFNPVYFASFAKKGIRKVSYAASIGLNSIPEKLIPEYKRLLSSFYAVGIREEEGRQLLKQSCGIDSTVVLDPTLLVDAEIYERMQRRVIGVKNPYLFCYFLNENNHYKDIVEKYAEKHNLQIIGVSSKESDSTWMMRLTGLGADHFLWLVNNADTVMTDSYHGSIFSLLFHKNLWIFQRFEESNPICQNSRIRQLDTYFKIGSRIVTSSQLIDESTPMDFEYFESELKLLRKSSFEFLSNALK